MAASGTQTGTTGQAGEIMPDASAPPFYNHMAYPSVDTSYQTSQQRPSGLDSFYAHADQPGHQQPHPLLMSQQSSKPYPANTIDLLATTRHSAVATAPGSPARAHMYVDVEPSRPMSPVAYAAGPAGLVTSSSQQHPDPAWQHWLVPTNTQRKYWAAWTSIFTLGACFVFAYMAGQFGTYQQSVTYMQYHNGTASSSPLLVSWGPSSLPNWLRFWVTRPEYSFDVGYLMNWGARYLPSIAVGDWWRLFSSICIHGGFSHLFSNMLALVILAVPLEHTYGPIRVFIIFVAAGLGGTFLSMAFEDHCLVYIGASGAVFGFLGLYLADIVLNFESMYRPLLRLGLMIVALGLTLGIEFAAARVSSVFKVSHMSHIGGLVAGLVISFMFLPNFKDRRWRSARQFASKLYGRISHGGSQQHAPLWVEKMQSCWTRNAWLYWLLWILSLLVVLFFFAGLPAYIWLAIIPGLQCPSLTPGGL